MRLVCLNAWGGALHAALMPWLAEVAPDILCLQEVVHTPAAPKPVLTYRDPDRDGDPHIDRAGDAGLAQRARLFTEIAAALPGHAATFCPATRGVLHDGDVAVPSLSGIATYVRDDLPVVAQSVRFVHGAFRDGGSGGGDGGHGPHPRPRPAHVLRVPAPGGGAVTLGHMHGLRIAAGKHDTPERLAQAERFAAMLDEVAERGDAIVACGDFNVLPDSGTFARLARLGLADLVTGGDHADTRTSHYPKPVRFADYMLVGGAIEVGRFDVVASPEVSDHRPLVLDFAVAPH